MFLVSVWTVLVFVQYAALSFLQQYHPAFTHWLQTHSASSVEGQRVLGALLGW